MKWTMLSKAHRIGDMRHLGQLVATYRGEWPLARKLSLGGLLVMVLTLMARALQDIFSTNPGMCEGGAIVLCFWVTGLCVCVVLVLYVLVWSYLLLPSYVLLYEEGLVVTHWLTLSAVRWDEVATVFIVSGHRDVIERIWDMFRGKLSSLPPRRCRIYTQQGRSLRFHRRFLPSEHQGSFPDLWARSRAESELIYRVEREVALRLWEQVVPIYQAGQPVSFGQVQVSRQGVCSWLGTLAWKDIERLVVFDAEGAIRRFSATEALSQAQQARPLSEPVPDLAVHLVYWHEDVGPSAWITLKRKDHQAPAWAWEVSAMPNALVFVALVTTILQQDEGESVSPFS